MKIIFYVWEVDIACYNVSSVICDIFGTWQQGTLKKNNMVDDKMLLHVNIEWIWICYGVEKIALLLSTWRIIRNEYRQVTSRVWDQLSLLIDNGTLVIHMDFK